MGLKEIAFQSDRMQVQHWAIELNKTSSAKTLISELALVLTPNVLATLPEPLQLDDGPEAIEGWVKRQRLESDIFTVRSRKTTKLLGLLILAAFKERSGRTTLHVGYLFAEIAWGKGFATELLSGLVRESKSQVMECGQIVLRAGVERANLASVRVLEKSGFKLVEAQVEIDTAFYEHSLE
jgi:tellurite methyltransferase